MMTFTDRKAMERAVNKAKSEKPAIKEQSHGVYTVRGSKNDIYTVTFAKIDGELQAECTCKAHNGSKAPKMCYHIMSCTSHYKMRVHERATARLAANWNATVCENCGGLSGGPDADEEHNTCQCAAKLAKDEADLFS